MALPCPTTDGSAAYDCQYLERGAGLFFGTGISTDSANQRAVALTRCGGYENTCYLYMDCSARCHTALQRQKWRLYRRVLCQSLGVHVGHRLAGKLLLCVVSHAYGGLVVPNADELLDYPTRRRLYTSHHPRYPECCRCQVSRAAQQNRPFPQCLGTVITAKNGTAAKCPSSAQLLGTFVAANVVSAIVGVVVGHQLVVRKLSCGLLGRHSTPHWSWAFTWLLPLGMHLAANAVIALVLLGNGDYITNFTQAELFFLFLTRPRAGWLPVVLAGQIFSFVNSRGGNDHIDTAAGDDTGAPGPDGVKRQTKRRRKDNYFAASAFSNYLAELVLQAAGLYVICLVIVEGVKRDV